MFNINSSLKLVIIAMVTLPWLLATGGCGSSRAVHKGPGGDDNLARLNRAARIAYDNGQLEQAARREAWPLLSGLESHTWPIHVGDLEPRGTGAV